VVPTRRLAVFASLATLLGVLGGYVPSVRPALFTVDLMIAFGVLIDILLATGKRVEIRRHAAAIFSVGRPNAVTILLRNFSGRALRGRFADDPFESCAVRGNPGVFALAPYGETSVTYEIVPTRRGTRTMGGVSVRYPSILGLVARQERCALPATVDVYPDVHAARSLELLRRQGRQDARLGSLRVRGGDTEFERLRPYQVGDEFRHIDWRASARRDDLVARQFQAESNQSIVFALDIGRAMRGESAGPARTPQAAGSSTLSDASPAAASSTPSRPPPGEAPAPPATLDGAEGLPLIDCALNAVLLTADVALRAGDKAGLVVFDDAPRLFVPPAAGLSAGRRLTRAVHAVEAGLAATDYAAAVGFLRSLVRERSLFVFFTQLLEARSARELASAVKSLLPKHLPMCVLLRDPDVEMLVTGPIRGADDLYVRAAAAEALAWRDGLVRGLASSGVLVVDATPLQLTPQLVKRYLEVKARRLL
jgi:uncharacterized protein (DUF58 family)